MALNRMGFEQWKGYSNPSVRNHLFFVLEGKEKKGMERKDEMASIVFGFSNFDYRS